jgi:hypothetical protein
MKLDLLFWVSIIPIKGPLKSAGFLFGLVEDETPGIGLWPEIVRKEAILQRPPGMSALFKGKLNPSVK